MSETWECAFKLNYKKLISWRIFVMFCAIWYHLYNFKNVKNSHGRVLPLVNSRLKVCNFTKSNTPPWVFSCFLNCTNDTKSRNNASLTKFLSARLLIVYWSPPLLKSFFQELHSMSISGRSSWKLWKKLIVHILENKFNFVGGNVFILPTFLTELLETVISLRFPMILQKGVIAVVDI